MAVAASQEGFIPFHTNLSDKPVSTYFKVIGDLEHDKTPLVIVHGGPGSGHEYLLVYGKLWERCGIPVIFYDQIGCASSTRVPEKMGDADFWKIDRFLAELDNVLDHFGLPETGYHMLGHSWGGILAIHHAGRRPQGLLRLALGGAPASGVLFNRGVHQMKDQLPEEDREAIDEAVAKDDFESPAYQHALGTFYRKHWSRGKPFRVDEVKPALQRQAEDKTTRSSMMGPSPFVMRGPFAHMKTQDCLPLIDVPTLVFNGEYDTAGDLATIPLFEHIPRVRWMAFPDGSHMLHADSPELQNKVLKVVGEFFRQRGKSI